MLRSIRWRLVASYALLTLFTISVVGVVALSLVKTSIDQQEMATLQASAEAIARQAAPLLWPATRERDLANLSQTAAFLGNNEVRILDSRQQLIATFRPSDSANTYVWLAPPALTGLEGDALGALLLSLPALQRANPLLGDLLPLSDPLLANLSPDTPVTVVRRQQELWGTRLIFETGTLGAFRQSLLSANTGAGNDHDAGTAPITVTAPIGDAQLPLGYVQLVRTASISSDALATVRQALILGGLGALLLSLLVGLIVSRGLTSPLRGLTVAAGRMSSGDLSTRAPVVGGAEIELLGRQFNEMAARLEANFAALAAERDALRHFIADASHELRTPITALQNFNELLQGAAADDPAARAEFLTESQTQLGRLEWITGHLLDLSRTQAGLVELERAVCDAGDLLETASSGFRPRAQEEGIDLVLAAPQPPFALNCDRARLEVALSNLIDNALKFTPRGGRVAVGAEQVGNSARFWVQDTGGGVAPEDQPHVFDRFYHGADGGTGLGLAIVRSIAQAHGGNAYLATTGPAGSKFVLETPLTG